MKAVKQRLDKEVLKRGLAETRQKAQGLILAGMVSVDGERVDKAGAQVGDAAVITVSGKDNPYVSRGGLKLKGALDGFGVNPSGFVCADIGASTGGFTDCLLKEGAAKVYAVDVGHGLIDASLKSDPRVVTIERVNVRSMGPEVIGELVEMATVDVAFISLRLVLGSIAGVLKPGGAILALVKPQFEVGRDKVGRGGIVKDEAERKRAVEEVAAFAKSIGLGVLGEMESPIKGAKGNVEFFLYLRKPV